ncbi:TolB family protein [Ferruginibacter sp.]
MIKPKLTLLLLASCACAAAQTKLTVEKIMRNPNWIGTSPDDLHWGNDGQTLYFTWNPDKAPSDSLYYITLKNKVPAKASLQEVQNFNSTGTYVYNNLRTAYIFTKDGDIFYTDSKTGKTKRITQTVDFESNPQFSFNETRIVYNRNQNLYAWDIVTGETLQLTNVKTADAATAPTNTFTRGGGAGAANAGRGGGGGNPNGNLQEDWLKNDQLKYFEVLRSRKEDREKGEAYNKQLPKPKELRAISIEDKNLQGIAISPDGRFINYRLSKAAANNKTTIVPNYVTESGFTTDIPGRSKVGAAQTTFEFFIYDRLRDTVIAIKTDSIPGIKDLPDYVKDYPKQMEERTRKASNRPVIVSSFVWSPMGSNAVAEIRSRDYKDRWLMLWDTASGKMKLLDRQRDEAWIWRARH